MAKLPAKSMKCWLDEFALAALVTGAGLDVSQEVPKVDTLGEAGPRRVVGNYDFTAPYLGLFDGDEDSLDEIIHALVGSNSDHYLALALGSSVGDVAYEGPVAISNKPINGQAGSAIVLNFEGMGRGGLSRGVLLGNKTTTGAESLTGVNQGATTSGQLYRSVFRLVTFDGTNITLKVQESSDDDPGGEGDEYADITGLTSGALTAAGTVVATTTAATEAYKRLNISGTFTSAVIVVTAGLVAGEE